MKRFYRLIPSIIALCSIVLVAKPDFNLDQAEARLIADRTYGLVQEENEFCAMHRKHTQGITLQELGLNEQTLNEKLMAVFNQTRQDFAQGKMELIVVKDNDELLGSVFFCLKEENGGYIRIQHLNSPVIDQPEIFAEIFKKMLPAIRQRFPSQSKIFCVTRTAIQVYKTALEAAGFTESDFLPQGCDCNSQVAYVFHIVD